MFHQIDICYNDQVEYREWNIPHDNGPIDIYRDSFHHENTSAEHHCDKYDDIEIQVRGIHWHLKV
jgi:hypothetical protein